MTNKLYGKDEYSHEQLIEILMDPSISKCEIEWAAHDEINRLLEENKRLEKEITEYISRIMEMGRVKDALRKENDKMSEIMLENLGLRQKIDQMQCVINNSSGVTGLHRSDCPLTWDWLIENDWLDLWEKLNR